MKRIFALLCAAALLASLAACSGQETAAPDPLASMSLQEVLDASLKNVPDLPKYEAVSLDADNFEFFSFVPYEQGFEGIEADSLMGSIAHSVVVIRVPAEKAEKVAETMKQNADPRKWICVEAEKVVVDRSGGTILLAMSGGETVNAILTNFKALYGAAPTAEELVLPALPEDGFVPGGTEVVTFPDPGLDPDLEETVGGPVQEDSASLPQEEPAIALQPEQPAAPEAPEVPEAPPAESPAESPAAEETADETDLSTAMARILDGAVDAELRLGELPLDAENLAYYAFIPWSDGCRGMVSEPMMGSIAHSVVLLELPTEADAARAAADMQANADPRKWICVEAEEVRAASRGRLALLVMTGPKQADIDAIFANFNAL